MHLVSTIDVKDFGAETLRIGDTVVLEKAGEVIPAVVEVVKSKRPRNAKPFDFLKHIHGKCPACGGVWLGPNDFRLLAEKDHRTWFDKWFLEEAKQIPYPDK